MLSRTAHLLGSLRIDIRIFKQSLAELQREHIGYGTVEVGIAYSALLKFCLQIVAEGIAAKVHIQSRLQGERRTLGIVAGSAVGSDGLNRVKVAICEALESPLATQHVGEQPAIGRAWHALNGVVRSHYGCCTSLDSLFERQQQFGAQRTLAHLHRIAVVSARRHAVCGKMLERTEHVLAVRCLALHALNYSRTEHRSQPRVFAEALFHTRPARLASHVEHGTVAHIAALRAHLAAHSVAHAVHKVGIPCAGTRQSRRIYGRADCHMTVRSLLSKQNRYAETGLLHCIFLQSVDGFGCKFGIKSRFQRLLRPRIGTQHSPERTYRGLAHHVLEFLRHLNAFVACLRVHLPSERTAQLCYLLLNGHAAQKVGYSLLNGARRLLVDRCVNDCLALCLGSLLCSCGLRGQCRCKKQD